MIEVRPADQQDADQLIAAQSEPAPRAHLRNRWAQQSRGEALFLLAHRDGSVVGHTMLLRESKYAEVRAAHGVPEVNALHAYEDGQGIGTALTAAAEAFATSWGHSAIGLAVGADNDRARRLYDHLGYRDWGQGTVVDEWTEEDAGGKLVRTHQDRCLYLVKTDLARS